MSNIVGILPDQKQAAAVASPSLGQRFKAGAVNALHSRQASSIFSAVIGGLVATSNSTAGLFVATTFFLASEVIRLSSDTRVAVKLVENAEKKLLIADTVATENKALITELTTENEILKANLQNALSAASETIASQPAPFSTFEPGEEGAEGMPAHPFAKSEFGRLPENATVVDAILNEPGAFDPNAFEKVFPTLH